MYILMYFTLDLTHCKSVREIQYAFERFHASISHLKHTMISISFSNGMHLSQTWINKWFRDNFIENCWKEQHVNDNCLKTVTGCWFGTCFIFHNIWDVILPIDELHHFSRWLKHVKSTNQVKRCVKNVFVWGRYLGFMKEHPLWNVPWFQQPRSTDQPVAVARCLFSELKTEEISYGKLPSNMVDSANEHMDFNVD